MKPDITSRENIKFIIATFYDKLLNDELMFPFFKEILEDNELEHHLEIITDFWEDLLLQTFKYKNNPMKKHLDFQKKMDFQKKHFELWLQYLTESITANFDGEIANAMKTMHYNIDKFVKRGGLYKW